MSHALRRLRDHFSDDLVIHGAGEAHLTPLGQALRPEVRRIMREVEGAFNYSIAFDPLTTTETITIAANDTNEQMLLGPVVRSLSTLAPGLRVNVMPLDIEQPARSLELGADLLLLSGDMAIDGLETMPILTDRASCLVWNRHPEFQDCLALPRRSTGRRAISWRVERRRRPSRSTRTASTSCARGASACAPHPGDPARDPDRQRSGRHGKCLGVSELCVDHAAPGVGGALCAPRYRAGRAVAAQPSRPDARLVRSPSEGLFRATL